jgi:3',5'-cyclic AMP phosphodiesterase CpdA
MTQLAHLSDLHLLEEGHHARRGLSRRRLSYLTFGRPNDHEDRRRRAGSALAVARASGADHVLVTGDLTEDGLDAQFEVLAELLADSRLAPERVTLLPGNHDAYVDGGAFARALAGPLRAYAATSTPGVPVALRDAVILPVSTAMAQPYTRSAGSIDGHALVAAEALAAQTRREGRSLVVAMHHPPGRRFPGMQWIDGLVEHAAMGAVLARHDHVHVAHGHIHTRSDDAVRPGARPRIFGAEAVVDADAPVRFYEARHGRMWAATELRWAGATPAMA